MRKRNEMGGVGEDMSCLKPKLKMRKVERFGGVIKMAAVAVKLCCEVLFTTS